MGLENFYYLLINLFVISVPLILSFDKKVHFYKRWKYFFPALISVAFVFIVWDILFTKAGVWGFNPRYLTGINLINLPIEEVLFFITIPYACTFIYDTIKAYLPLYSLEKTGALVYAVVFVFTVYLVFFHTEKWYSISTAIASALTLAFLVLKKRLYFGRIGFTYLISIIPFLLINGILTGTGIDEQIVWYNAEMFSGIRAGTIPMEDFFYGFSLIALNIIGYEEWMLADKAKSLFYVKQIPNKVETN
jgi:lycopene cyclase domain-containing protein